MKKILLLCLILMLVGFVLVEAQEKDIANLNPVTSPKLIAHVSTTGIVNKRKVDLTVELVNDHPSYNLNGKIVCNAGDYTEVTGGFGEAGVGGAYSNTVSLPPNGQDYLEMSVSSKVAGIKKFYCYFTGIVTKKGEHGEILYVTYDQTFTDKREDAAPFAAEVLKNVEFAPEAEESEDDGLPGFSLIIMLSSFVLAMIFVKKNI